MQHESTPGDELAMSGGDGGAGRTEKAPRRSRRRFLGGTAATAAAGMVLAAPGVAEAAVSLPQLYAGQNRSIFRNILADENSHTNFLIGLLGAASRPKPTFRNLVAANVKQFAARAAGFENIGSRSYAAFEPYLNNPANLSAAIRIGAVESRHSGYLNALTNQPLVPARLAFEPLMQQFEVVTNISPFIASLNGGPPPAYELFRTDANDINILNFALLLEFLQSEFYNINVPRFFS